MWIKEFNCWFKKSLHTYLPSSVYFILLLIKYRKKESCVINPREITNIEQFNGDTHNTVYYGIYHNTPVFIKTISVINTEINAIKRECEIQSSLSNPFIAQFIGYYIVDNSISFVTKRAECTLLEFLQNNPTLTIIQKKYILYSIAYGLTYLQWKKVMHHDLKVTIGLFSLLLLAYKYLSW